MNFKKALLVIVLLFTSGTAFAESFVEFVIVDKVWPDHKWGHVSLRVKDDATDMVFDFGRYGKMWGFFDTEGEPILRVWKHANEQHLKYQKEGQPQIHNVRFQVSSNDAQAVLAHFEKLTRGLKPFSSTKHLDYYNLQSPTFHAISHNCTTLSIEAFSSAFPNMKVDSTEFAKGEGLYKWAKIKAVSLDYDSRTKRWGHIWWPQDLLESLRSQFVANGLAEETTL
ncbi:MAG: hypothetical protein H7326_04515 [Bdellovibrionaceae bacterium]|nr:hypothetical protein [Pseudobdellovibrionaceae bacterium]